MKITHQEMRKFFPQVEYFKQNMVTLRAPEKEGLSATISLIGLRIVEEGYSDFESLHTGELMAAIFAVNFLTKDKCDAYLSAGATIVKNELQVMLLRYHSGKVTTTDGTGKYSNCIEIRYKIWTTHIPKAAVPRVLAPLVRKAQDHGA